MDVSKKKMHKDRFGFTMFLSISLHAIILIGLGLAFPVKELNESMEISLVHRNLSQQVLFSDVVQNPKTENFRVQMEHLPSTGKVKPSLELMIKDLQLRLENRRKSKNQRPQRDTISTVSA